MNEVAQHPPRAAGVPTGAAGPGPRGAFARALGGHRGPLLALAAVHAVVFARSLFATKAGLFYIPWDFDSSYHRYLVYIGDCLRSGTFPLWNPFNAAGTPFYANPQSQIWSPVTLVVASLLGYTHDTAQRQLILTVLFGGVGAYLLAHELWRCRLAAFVAGACYDLTSAVFSNMEHMDIVNAYALLPWWFWAATRAARGRRLALPGLAFLLYWGITAGYPAVVGMGLLWLAAYWVYLAVKRFETAGARIRFVAHGAAAGALAVALSAAHWVPVLVNRSVFARGAPLDIDVALAGGLGFAHLWGLLFNFTTSTPFEGATLDASMVGVYVGAVALPLAALSILRERERLVRVLVVAAAGMLLMSLGGLFFGRVALHWLVPPFNLARFPAADSRTSMVLCLALLAGSGARLLYRRGGDIRELAVKLYSTTWIILGIAGVALRVSVYRGMSQADYFNRVLGGISAQMLFVGALLLVLRRGSGPRALAACLSLLLALDLGTDVLLNYHPVGMRVSPADRRAREATYRHGFDAGAADEPRIVPEPPVSELQWELSLQAMTSKRFHLADYGPFRLKRFQDLVQRGFAGWLTTGRRVVALPPGAQPRSYQEFSAAMAPVSYRIASYGPNEVRYELTADTEELLAFNEVYFPGWRAWVDGATAPVVEVAGGLRGVRVGPGVHSIVTRFRPPEFYVGLGVTLASFAALAGWVALAARSVRRRPEGGGLDPMPIS